MRFWFQFRTGSDNLEGFSLTHFLQKIAIVRPTQLATQCVANRIGLVKLARVLEVGIVETFVVLRSQNRSKIFLEIFAISRPFFTLLFVLDNLLPDLPVGTDHLMIDNRLNPIASGFDDGGDTPGKFGYRRLDRLWVL